MAKSICCRDAGIDCDFKETAETVDELLRQCVNHAKSVRGIEEIPPELAARVQ